MWRFASTISRSCFRTTNRLAEAEPLMRRALAIVETSFGPIIPTVTARDNLALLEHEPPRRSRTALRRAR